MAKTATKKAPAKPAPKSANKPAAQTASRAAQPVGRTGINPQAQTETVRKEDVQKLPATRQSALVPAEVLNQLPAHMQSDVDMGKENIDKSDMDMPRLKLIQGLSKELQLYDELKAGHFFHTASEITFDEAFRVVPIFMDKQYILWRPLEDGGGILARAPDGVNWQPSHGEFEVKLDRKDGGNKVKWKLAPTVQQSGLAAWGTMNPENNNSPPAATLMYNFLLAFPDFPEVMPAVLTFQRSSIKIGRKFMTKLMTVRTPLFGSVFTLSSTEDHNSANQDFKNISLVGSGLVEDPDQYESYKNLHLSLARSGLNIRDVDSLQGEEEAGSGGAEAPGTPGY